MEQAEFLKRLQRLENQLSAHTHSLIRGFEKIERLAIELEMTELVTETQREIAALRTLRP